MDVSRLRVLLDRYVDGMILVDEKAELEAMLLESTRAREEFWDHAGWNATLREHGVRSWAVDPVAKLPAVMQSTKVRTFRLWISGAAVIAIGILIGLFAYSLNRQPQSLPSSPSPISSDETTTDGVAVLTQSINAIWEDANMPTKVGSTLSVGTLKLRSGLAQIEFFSGGAVVLEGPAEFKLLSPREAFLVSGKLRVHVTSQAQGFRVCSSAVDVVDLGTEFGMQTSAGGPTYVHVFDGKVELYEPSTPRTAKPKQTISQGRGVRLDRDGGSTDTSATFENYVSTADINRRMNTLPDALKRVWQEHQLSVKQDPRLLDYFDFENQQPWERFLSNRANGSQSGGDATIVGCQWVQGLWPGKGALDFRRTGDRVRLQVPGDLDSFTFALSLRIDSMENRYNAIFMSDDYGVGATHWQIARDGSITLGIQGAGEKGGVNYTTPPILGPNQMGQWVHLAVVVNAAEKTVTHYVDGRAMLTQPIVHTVKVHIGAAQLGNWGHSAQWKSVPVRNFSGRMDEFMIFGASLNAKEIQALDRRAPIQPN